MTTSAISKADWLTLLVKSQWDRSLRSPHGDPMPDFPSAEFQRNTTSLDGEAAMRQAHGFYSDICDALDDVGRPLDARSSVFDFGSCWGRITRCFMRDVPLANLHGMDVDSNFVAECRRLFDSANFKTCNALPPCDAGDGSVDLVTAYSVFSHLSEAAFLAWMREFHRILKPGGHLAFTTRNEAFMAYCSSLRESNEGLTGYSRALAEMASGLDAARERYAAGEFVFITNQQLAGGGAMNESFYGEAFIPQDYVARNLSNCFNLIRFKPVGNGYDQALFVLEKVSA